MNRAARRKAQKAFRKNVSKINKMSDTQMEDMINKFKQEMTAGVPNEETIIAGREIKEV